MSWSLTRRISPTSASAKVHAAFLRPGLLIETRQEKGEEGSRRAPVAGEPDDDNRPSPLSLTPIRFAFPMTALREAAPSVCAMTFALLPSIASFFRIAIASSVHSMSGPLALRRAPDGMILRACSIRFRSRGRRWRGRRCSW
jgi:hypothetical protein